jgi:two-component system, NtrC family, response regulator
MKKKLLVIEDELSLAKQLKWGLTDTYEVMIADNVRKAEELLGTRAFPLATLDLGLPPSPDDPREGLRLLEKTPALSPHTKVVVITGNTEQGNAMRAIAAGAVDFCEKPIDLETLKVILQRAGRIYKWEEASRKQDQGDGSSNKGFCGMIGTSPAMDHLFDTIRRVSDTDYPVLVLGESGTGKEMVARALHELSRRSQGPLIIINCGAIPENLLESELFGHEKGAFTGAAARKIGRFEQADGGSIFLDEIGDMPIMLQVKLLRFLQEGTIERVGGKETMKLDVRVIAATHVHLESAVREGRFREDLFYRLNVVPLEVPPLRDRKEDILQLAHHFIAEESKKLKRGKISLSSAAAAAMSDHSWPGNVRELQNAIYRALATARDGRNLKPSDLGLKEASRAVDTQLLTIRQAREAAEYRVIRRALGITENNISKAAKLLAISRPTLHDLLKKHGID